MEAEKSHSQHLPPGKPVKQGAWLNPNLEAAGLGKAML